MRIFLTSISRYPARHGGLSSSRVNDCLAKGLSELGHTVYYCVAEGYSTPLPDGVIASRRCEDADLYHLAEYPCGGTPPPRGRRWLRTVHCPYSDGYAKFSTDHFVFVSRHQAQAYGAERYVWNGIDPSELIYNSSKSDYVLFIVSKLTRAEQKGLLTAIRVAEHVGARLLVAGQVDLYPFPSHLLSPSVTYLGEITGQWKAILLAEARALLFPGHVAETFGLVVAEALMSGTPVIAGRHGALPELVTPQVGFTCHTFGEYVSAMEHIAEIEPEQCRQRAVSEFHYRVMARRYVTEYERELAR